MCRWPGAGRCSNSHQLIEHGKRPARAQLCLQGGSLNLALAIRQASGRASDHAGQRGRAARDGAEQLTHGGERLTGEQLILKARRARAANWIGDEVLGESVIG